MKRKYFDDLLRMGVITKEEYNDVLTKMRVTEGGDLIGAIPKENYINKYNLEGDMLEGDLHEFVKKHILPPYDFVDIEPFCKYGMLYCGICDKWSWFTEENISLQAIKLGYRPIEEAAQEELWKMIAMASRYWEVCYKRWYHEEREENNCLSQNH